MTPLEIIEAASSRPLTTEDGDRLDLVLSPGMSSTEIDTFEQTLPARLPLTIRELLARCRGLEGPLESVDFTGSSMDFEQLEVFPHGLPIAGDGYGNFWVIDLTPESTDWGPIYFACHDAPVILLQSQNLAGFLVELFKMCEPPFKSLIDDVHEDRLFDVWGKNPNVRSTEEAKILEDEKLSAFAEELGPGWSIVDLREAQPGQGFSWGRYGPQTEIRRHDFDPIFAYHKPAKKRFFGLWG